MRIHPYAELELVQRAVLQGVSLGFTHIAKENNPKTTTEEIVSQITQHVMESLLGIIVFDEPPVYKEEEKEEKE